MRVHRAFRPAGRAGRIKPEAVARRRGSACRLAGPRASAISKAISAIPPASPPETTGSGAGPGTIANAAFILSAIGLEDETRARPAVGGV